MTQTAVIVSLCRYSEPPEVCGWIFVLKPESQTPVPCAGVKLQEAWTPEGSETTSLSWGWKPLYVSDRLAVIPYGISNAWHKETKRCQSQTFLWRDKIAFTSIVRCRFLRFGTRVISATAIYCNTSQNKSKYILCHYLQAEVAFNVV
jgi:hypothetical protein